MKDFSEFDFAVIFLAFATFSYMMLDISINGMNDANFLAAVWSLIAVFSKSKTSIQ